MEPFTQVLRFGLGEINDEEVMDLIGVNQIVVAESNQRRETHATWRCWSTTLTRPF